MDEPRKKKQRGKPQWDNRPPGYSDDIQVPKNLVLELAEICECVSETKVQSLAERLQDEFANLTAAKYIVETEVSDVDQRAALDKLFPRASELHSLLERADLSTRRDIINAYQGPMLPHEVDLIEAQEKLNVIYPQKTNTPEPVDSYQLFLRDIAHLERLRNAVREARLRIKPSRGPKGVAMLDHACMVFANLYKEFSFDYPIYDSKKDEHFYKPKGAQFVLRPSQWSSLMFQSAN